MDKKISITFIIIMTLILPIYGQEYWSLNDCVNYAMEHNLQLNDFKYDELSSHEDTKQSYRDLLPKVRAVSEYNIRYGRSVNPNDNGFINTDFFSNSYSLEGSFDLFQGFQKVNRIKATRLIYQATKEEVKQQKYLLAFRVMQAFYDIKFFEGALKIAKEQLGISQANYDLVSKQIELDIKAGADLYEAESLLLTDKLNFKRVKNQLAEAKLILIQEMNLEGQTDIRLEDNLTDYKSAIEENQLTLATDSIYLMSQQFLPIIKARKLRVEAAKRQLAIERGQFYPSLSLFGGIGTGYYETIIDNSSGETNSPVLFRKQFKNNGYKIIGLSLNIPISNGWTKWSDVNQQRIRGLKAENALLTQQQELYKIIQSLVQENNALRIEYAQSIKNLEAQKLAFKVAQKRYKKGLINAVELYTVKNLFVSAQNENLQVRLQSEVNNSTLDFYRGLPIFNMH